MDVQDVGRTLTSAIQNFNPVQVLRLDKDFHSSSNLGLGDAMPALVESFMVREDLGELWKVWDEEDLVSRWWSWDKKLSWIWEGGLRFVKLAMKFD